MSLPDTKEGLEAIGWVFDGEGRCKGCGEYLEWWTTNKNRKMPMSVIEVRKDDKLTNPVERLKRISHFENCPNAKDFRAKKR